MFLLIGGLGDSGLSLSPWESHLRRYGVTPTYVPVEISGKTGFAHRVETLCAAIEQSNEPVTIIGQSAGGLAALIASTRYPNKVRGVIAVSPAMPHGISPLGWPLLKVMWRYEWAMLRHKLIAVKAEDYKKIALNGVKKYWEEELLFYRKEISGREALELSILWLQPKLSRVCVPTIILSGSDDRWVSPRAHQHLVDKIHRDGGTCEFHQIRGTGHLPAHSERGPMIVYEMLRRLNESMD